MLREGENIDQWKMVNSGTILLNRRARKNHNKKMD